MSEFFRKPLQVYSSPVSTRAVKKKHEKKSLQKLEKADRRVTLRNTRKKGHLQKYVTQYANKFDMHAAG